MDEVPASLGTNEPDAGMSLPALSVVVVVVRRFDAVRRTLRHLRAQTIRERIELILVMPSASVARECEETALEGFYGVRVLVVGEIVNPDKVGAAAVRVASAPIVAFIEDHAYPEPTWAEHTVDAHRGPWSVVGAAIVNANTKHAWSWANHLVTYGPWSTFSLAGERTSVSRHNTSFKRDVLSELGGSLESAFGREGTLLPILRRNGHRFYFEPRAQVAHVSPSLGWTTLALRFRAGRLFAYKRVRAGKWSIPKRLLYSAAAPIYPFIRLRQIWSESFAGGRQRDLLPRVLPALGSALVSDALGQAIGYLTGPGDAVSWLADLEMERAPHVTPGDRALLVDDEQPPSSGGSLATSSTQRVRINSPADAPVRFALIGFGRVVQLSHLPAIRRLRSLRLVAIADPDESRLAEARRLAPGARTVADHRELLADPAIDAVLIAAPPALHAGLAVRAFASGKHVYIEKPLATTLGDGRCVIDAWREAGTVGMVGHNLRCHPVFRSARLRLEQGVIGEPLFVRSVFSAAHRALPDWKTRRDTGGGVVLDLATHHVDLMRFLFAQEISDARLEEWTHRTDADSATLHLRLASGLRVESLFSLTTIAEDRVEIFGSDGLLAVDRYAGHVRVRSPRRGQGRTSELGAAVRALGGAVRRAAAPPGEPSYAIALGRFAMAIRDGGNALPDLDDGLRALEVVLGARQAE